MPEIEVSSRKNFIVRYPLFLSQTLHHEKQENMILSCSQALRDFMNKAFSANIAKFKSKIYIWIQDVLNMKI